ncbi:MAG: hypothetical protein DWQ34_13320 [Planctomycetota bacterium]|nr:MAG: hypothetical protein DWQ29_14055 [Planctomycetota bacterium]REJ92278.1 MAG: hypothetical protein DWQ34_13320 [Planctomycetota bacterium]REK30617.1 MAG: hypothetical protein DWQ41_01300 [Planctomycetota bacterium]REK32991.1 MAG: hypothetical protein DWQ45_15400 [Planctomycetota bacterium]
MTIDENVAECRAYREERARFNERLQASLEQARRGEIEPMDAESLKDEIRKELTEEGLTD